jgi:hypothetical protein
MLRELRATPHWAWMPAHHRLYEAQDAQDVPSLNSLNILSMPRHLWYIDVPMEQLWELLHGQLTLSHIHSLEL